MEPVIEFQNISKRYKIGVAGANLRNALEDLAKRICGKRSQKEYMWALRDVSFKVERGESLGILGHNGAGKTTVLKILTGTTYPTCGTSKIRGKFGSLIELGAGFHPEMTGRENVFLNGVILGMSRKEVSAKFDEIVDFSGIAHYIDTPVKRYSSGMYVRLAFAVAAHINPDVLLVDEVLAVGDINFRVKCYRRMAELRKKGTTIVLVSHDIHAIRDTCDRALLFWQGELVEDGYTDDVASVYLARMQSINTESNARIGIEPDSGEGNITDFVKPENPKAEIIEVKFLDKCGTEIKTLKSGDKLVVRICYKTKEKISDPIFRIDFFQQNRLYSGFSTAYDGGQLLPINGEGEVNLQIDKFLVPPGVYAVTVVIADCFEYNLMDVRHQAYHINVLRTPNSRGEILFPHVWVHRD